MSAADTRSQSALRRTSDESQYQQHFPPPIPPSPTLTNPDMILPFEDGERENSTPSPPFQLPTLSQLQSAYSNQHLQGEPSGDTSVDGAQIGVAISGLNRPQKKGFPRHTWMNEGLDSSRRLSDIGEEDASPPSRTDMYQGHMHVMAQKPASASSPTLREHREVRGKDTGGWSSSSSSTISAASDSSQWVTVKNQNGDTAHLGVDQPVRANSRGSNERLSPNPSRNSVASVAGEEGPGQDTSSAILSSEAERILENAKKRLTLMEGNLNKARSSMRLSPSLSPSPTPSGTHPLGLHQPVGGLYRSISRTDRKSSAFRPRQMYSLNQDAGNNRHSRVQSETNLPSNQPSISPTESNPNRSMSAMGSSTLTHNDERSFQYDPTRAYLTHRASASSFRPLGSDEGRAALGKEGVASDEPKGLGISTGSDESSTSSMEDLRHHLPRSQSQMQVRDLQDQMKGLHIKISSLKVKQQEDNLRRRSLQSLRTPSPFTAADQWYTSALEYKDSNGSLNVNAGLGWSSEHARETPRNDRIENDRDGYEPRSVNPKSNEPTPRTSPRQPDYDNQVSDSMDGDDANSVIESLYEDAEEGDGTDGSWNDYDMNDSLDAFPAVPHTYEETPHEEREDAFDYEHFILHSALGNYSRAKLRRSSTSSIGSVETTRPAHSRHSRANSTTSVSTVATFATAIEGEPHDDDDELESVLYWDKKFNHELRSQQKHRHSQRYPSHDSAVASEESVTDTPRAARRQPSRNSSSRRFSQNLSLPVRSPSSLRAESATPKSLVSSLVSTVRAASSPNPGPATNGTSGLNNDDELLLEQLFQSLGNVCMELQTITTTADHDPKAARLLRRRLDAARRVLDGELDA